MKNLLYLVHRIPYPPNKGDKISSFNLLRYLSTQYNVYLGTFIDDPADKAYIDKVKEYCVDTCFVDLDPKSAKILSLRGLLKGEALTLSYYRNATLQAWVDQTIENVSPDAGLIYSGAMGQYLAGIAGEVPIVFDIEDIDSDKWRSYAETKPWPLSWLYARESRTLFAFEREMARQFSVSVFISPAEAKLFQEMAPEVKDRVTYRTQGVDTAYFDPHQDFDNPYSEDMLPLVFCGAMDYWPNVDAVCWYVEEIFPKVREKYPNAQFCIVGMNPSSEVKALASHEGVMVTGSVPDVRPYVVHASAAVLPLRIARGIQNKALEAMALEKPLVASPSAMAGIVECEEFSPAIGETADELLNATLDTLDSGVTSAPGARKCILKHYNWDTNLKRIAQMLENGSLENDAI